MEKRKCKICNKEFELTVPNRLYCDEHKWNKKTKKKVIFKKICPICNNEFETTNNKKIYDYKECQTIAKTTRRKGVKKTTPFKEAKKIEKQIEIDQRKYKISNGINCINRFEKIAKEVFDNMQILDIDVYSNNVKSVCIDIMKEVKKFLDNELKINKDRRVINVGYTS